MPLSPLQLKHARLLLWSTAGLGFIAIVIGITVGAFEQDIGERRGPFFARSSPTPFTHSAESPTPLPPYLPYAAAFRGNKAQFVDSFLQATIGKGEDPEQGDRLFRWEQNEIAFSLRGQPTEDDRSCVSKTTGTLNTVMNTAKFKTTPPATRADIELYVLTKEQFTSVNPDAPTDKPSALLSRQNGYAILIDHAESKDTRCFLIHARVLQALGLPYLFEPGASKSIPHEARTPGPTGYSNYELELVRLLYSKYLVTGLSRIEMQRRLLP